MPLYRIKDWDMLYETNVSRKILHLRYVYTPNKHDGKGYLKITRHEKNCEIFSAWILLLQIASKCPKRGTLSDDAEGKQPLSIEDIALKTGFPEKIFTEAIPFLVHKLKWIEEIKTDEEKEQQKQQEENKSIPQEKKKEPQKEKPAEQLKQLFIPDEIKKEFDDFLEMRKKIRKPATERAKELVLIELNKLAPNDYNKQKQILNQSIKNSWQDVYELKQNGSNNNGWKS